MQETWVWSLSQEDPACRGAAKTMRQHNYWACAPEPTGCNANCLSVPRESTTQHTTRRKEKGRRRKRRRWFHNSMPSFLSKVITAIWLSTQNSLWNVLFCQLTLHILFSKITTQRTYYIAQELYSVLCGDLKGKEIQKRVDICIRVADSLCCTAEIDTIL